MRTMVVWAKRVAVAGLCRTAAFVILSRSHILQPEPIYALALVILIRNPLLFSLRSPQLSFYVCLE